jgi:hypothetical protein
MTRFSLSDVDISILIEDGGIFISDSDTKRLGATQALRLSPRLRLRMRHRGSMPLNHSLANSVVADIDISDLAL